jgi:ferrous iron transport protein A
LSALPRGRTARIVAVGDAVGSDGDLELRLLEIGFEEGKEVEVLHAGPIGGDPMVIRVDRTNIAIRRSDARAVIVEPGR